MAAIDDTSPSYLLDYLPEIYQQDPFIGRFLRIFEEVLAPIERMLDSMPAYFDPTVTRPDVLEWLAGWLGVSLDERWPLIRRRVYVRRASELFSLRGTARGLSIAIEALTGIIPEITQPTVAELANDPAQRQFRFRVTLHTPDSVTIDREALERAIEAEKPAFAAYALEIVRAD